MAHYQNYIIPSQQLLQIVVLKDQGVFLLRGEYFFDTKLPKKVHVRHNKNKCNMIIFIFILCKN